MKINKLNIDKICSVKSYVNCVCHHYEYKKAKKILFFCIQKEGYYEKHYFKSDSYMPIELLEKSAHLFCKDEKVYYKPHLEIRMSNQKTHDIYFETEKELHDFMERGEMRGINWVNI